MIIKKTEGHYFKAITDDFWLGMIGYTANIFKIVPIISGVGGTIFGSRPRRGFRAAPGRWRILEILQKIS